MNKLSSIIYRLRNILFILFMIGLIRLIPNIKELDFIGTIFIIFLIVYLLLDLYFYGCKNKYLNNLYLLDYTYILEIINDRLKSEHISIISINPL